jgi:hypothetical protein
MGNTQTKEARQHRSASPTHQHTPTAVNDASRNERPSDLAASERTAIPYTSRAGRSSRADLSFLGLGSSNDREVTNADIRRETKQERDARRLEKERAARLKERERSMRDEHVDGGYLVTQGVYVGIEDYNKTVVRQLMVCAP